MLYNGHMIAGTGACLLAALGLIVSAEAQDQEPIAKAKTISVTPKANQNGTKTEPRVLCLPDIDGLKATVAVNPAFMTTWHFREQLIGVVLGNKAEYPYQFDDTRKRVSIQPVSRATATNMTAETDSARMAFRLVPSAPDKAIDLVLLIDPNSKNKPPQCEKPPSKPKQAGDQNHPFLDAKLSEKEVLDPVTASFQSDAHHLELRTGPRSIGNDRIWFNFVVRNVGEQAFPTTGLALGDGKTNTEYLIDWKVEGGELPGELAPGQALRAALLASNPEVLRKGFVLQLLSNRSVVAAAFNWDDKPPPQPANKERIAIRAQLVGGALQLDDGIGINENEWTTEFGAGARVSYGISQNLTLEGDLAILKSGTASFGTVTWDEATGVLERNTTTARVLVGAVLHAGESYVPFVRLALGPRFFSDDRRLTSGAKSESDFDVGLAVSFEIGIDIWRGESYTLGLAGEYGTALTGDEIQSVEGRFHLGYAFKP